MTGFSVFQKESRGVRILECGGRLEGGCHRYLTKAIDSLIADKTTDIVFDMNDVHYISSSGWGVFICSLKKVRDKGGDLRLANLRFKVKYVFSLLELGNVIEAYNSVEEAVKSFTAKKQRTENRD